MSRCDPASSPIARRLNHLVRRRGPVFADRWHGRALTSPRAVRHALVYVLANFKKHGASRGSNLDAYSSAPYFTDFAGYHGKPPLEVHPRLRPSGGTGPPTAAPRTWLLGEGWRRHGLISIHESPASER
jgi:hypothetical protein